ncbi:MAG: P-type DNA transfer protein VirB5 [Betaproteobacteria bacterium]|nr:P-type DNA transfer protein VirB5 [Betaproteobacteria bacterium]MCL2885600.1 P-type DNA transfer protein VirB5 [Betaproteobacteria bacterium]
MKALKKFFGAATLTLGLALGNSAHAGIPVIDAANLAQAIQQVASWAQQYEQMVDQLKQMEQAYENLNGIRNMGSLVNNPLARKYLPAEYQTILSQGVGQWQSIYDAAKKFDMATSSLSASSDAAQAFQQIAKQAAINRATAEEAYKTASQRFDDIQVLLDKVNAAPDAKDIADLQARIQAEQVMMQNEANKLQMLAQLASAQKDLQNQQAREIGMKALRGSPPRF